MLALELFSAGDLRVTNRPRPVTGPHDVVVAVEWGGICGSDTSYWTSGSSGSAVQRHPLVLGHEVSGRILRTGEQVAGVAVGDAVTVHPARTVGELPARLRGRDNLHPRLTYLGSAARDPHTDGGFVEELLVPEGQVRRLPEGLSTRRAVLAEPLAVGLHAVQRAGDVRGADVLVSGCGPVGALTVIALRWAGAASIAVVDPSPAARALAVELGATSAHDVGAPVEGEHEIAFEASGSAASLGWLVRTVAVGGTIVQVGNLPVGPVSVPLGPLVSRELTYRGAYRFVDEITQALVVLAATPAAERVITHEFAARDVVAAFTSAVQDPESSKVVLRFGTP